VFQRKRGLYLNFTKARKFKANQIFSYKPKSLNVADCFNSKVKLIS